MSETSIIHVFDKGDYSKHRLVILPPSSRPTLGLSSLRLRTRILGQTTNNLSYANLGFAMGWWDVYPLPSNAPAPYNDRTSYATIAGWGYAEVLESTVPDIPAGTSVYGYVHIGTGAWDVRIQHTEHKKQILVTSEHRQHLWKLYNRLSIHPRLEDLEQENGKGKGVDGLGWDALMQTLFGTGYNLSTYGFAWEEGKRIHPIGEGEWSAEDANMHDSLVVILNASGKTGMSFAYALRRDRPKEHQPKRVVGVGSEKSSALIEKCGFYDSVLLNGDAEKVEQVVEKEMPRRVLLFDFGARPGTMASYTDALSSTNVTLSRFFVGGDNRPAKAEDLMKARGSRGEGVQVDANTLREKGIEVGGEKYFEDFDKAWEGFKEQGAIKGMKLVWSEGMEGWEKGWEAFCKDEVPGNEGRVYKL